jgi:hypothetical protein
MNFCWGANLSQVWVFNAANSRFPSGVFSTKDLAEAWIRENKLTGTLTAYPLDIGVFNWAKANNLIEKSTQDVDAEYTGRFTSASQEHYNYENGQND